MVDFTNTSEPRKNVNPTQAGNELLAEQGIGHRTGNAHKEPEIHTIPQRFLPSKRRQMSFAADRDEHRHGSRKSRLLLIAGASIVLIVLAGVAYLLLKNVFSSTNTNSTGNLNTNIPLNTSNATNAKTTARERYRDSLRGFTIEYPADWIVDTSSAAGVVVAFQSPVNTRSITGTLNTPTLEVYWIERNDDVIEPLDALATIDEDLSPTGATTKELDIDGKEGIVRTTSAELYGETHTIFDTVVLYDDVVVVMHGVAHPDVWDTMAPAFTSMASSFKRTTSTNANTNANANTNVNANANTNANANSNVNAFINTNTIRPSSQDSDDDGLTDVEETLYGSTSSQPDTDGDGYLDGDEVVNGFSPVDAGGVKLTTTTLVKTYTNPIYTYSILYPSSWLAQSTTKDNKEIIFTSDGSTGEFVIVTVEDNLSQLSPKQWYLNASPGVDPDSVATIAIENLVAAKSPDLRTVYIGSGNRMFVVNYNAGTLAEVHYQSTYDMMVRSFVLTQQGQGSDQEEAAATARDAVRQSDIRLLGAAIDLSLEDNDEPPSVPTTWSALGDLLQSYLANTISEPPGDSELAACSTDGDPASWALTNCYWYCTDGTDYIVGSVLESSQLISSTDMDGASAFDAGSCIASSGTVSTKATSSSLCADPVYCTGTTSD